MLILAATVTPAVAGDQETHFRTVDICIDPAGAALAAYQLELAVTSGEAVIVGVEGGDHPAFAEPPYYDPAALRGGRIILAAFDTSDRLPAGPTRVATVHFRESGAPPIYDVRLIVTAGKDGKKIDARAFAGTGANDHTCAAGASRVFSAALRAHERGLQ